MEPDWLIWGRELQAISQNGLTFATDAFDIERYEAVRALAAEIMARHSGVSGERVVELFRGQSGYATPKVDVRGAVFRGDTILLVSELADGGRWTLPGGWADVNETPAESIAREVREESGLETVTRKLVAAYDRARQGHEPPLPFHVWKLFFICDEVGGREQGSLETGEAAFFPEDQLPELSPGRVLTAQIRTLFEHHRRPELPTVFD